MITKAILFTDFMVCMTAISMLDGIYGEQASIAALISGAVLIAAAFVAEKKSCHV